MTSCSQLWKKRDVACTSYWLADIPEMWLSLKMFHPKPARLGAHRGARAKQWSHLAAHTAAADQPSKRTTQTLLPTPQTALAMSVWWRRQRGGGVYLQPWDENYFSPTFFLTHHPNCIFKPLLTRRSTDEQRECLVKEFAEQRCSPSISCCLQLLSLHFWGTFKINYAMM